MLFILFYSASTSEFLNCLKYRCRNDVFNVMNFFTPYAPQPTVYPQPEPTPRHNEHTYCKDVLLSPETADLLNVHHFLLRYAAGSLDSQASGMDEACYR